MIRAQRNLHKTGAALAAPATRIPMTGVAGVLLLAALLALPAASHEAPAPRTADGMVAPADTARKTLSDPAAPADSARPAPSRPTIPPTRTTRATAPTAVDPFVCALVGIIPLSSGYYLTSAPTKGIAFSLADAVLIGSIWNIRRDDNIPDGDVAPYFVLLGAVNALDAILSGLQARNDAVRVRTTLTPSGEPTVGLAWTF